MLLCRSRNNLPHGGHSTWHGQISSLCSSCQWCSFCNQEDYHYFFSYGAAAQRGLGPPHSRRGFWITHNDDPQSVGLLWTSDQLVAETSTWQDTTHKRRTSMPPVGRTYNLSRRAAAGLRLRPRGHWDRLSLLVIHPKWLSKMNNVIPPWNFNRDWIQCNFLALAAALGVWTVVQPRETDLTRRSRQSIRLYTRLSFHGLSDISLTPSSALTEQKANFMSALDWGEA